VIEEIKNQKSITREFGVVPAYQKSTGKWLYSERDSMLSGTVPI